MRIAAKTSPPSARLSSEGPVAQSATFARQAIESPRPERRTPGAQHGARVALFIEHLGDGGAQRVLLKLARELSREVKRVDLIVARLEGNRVSQIDPNVRVINLNIKIKSFFWILPALVRFVRYLRHNRPNAVLSFVGQANFVAIWARFIARVDTHVVVSVRSFISGYLRHIGWIKAATAKWIMRRTYWRADEVIAVSAGIADNVAELARIPRAKIKVIGNPVLDQNLLEQASERVSHPWCDSNCDLLVAVGRLCREKRFDVFLDALCIVCTSKPKVKAIIVGEGPKRAELEAQIERSGLAGCVDLVGWDANPLKYVTHARVLVLSSEQEGLPNVLIEAMACGCPVVSTDCPFGPAEILVGGRYGRLVPVGNVRAMARAILETLDNPPDPEPLRRRAGDFRVDRIVERYREVLRL